MNEPIPENSAAVLVDPLRGISITPNRERQIIYDMLIPDGLREPPALFTTKWFDYRRLSPVQATYEFAHQYSRSYRRFSVRRIGIESGQYCLGFSGGDIFKKPQLYRPFWKARQIADQLGIPYDFFNNQAMNWCDKSLWINLPRPTHLYGDKLINVIATAWESNLEASIPTPQDDWFLAKNYVQHPTQEAFQHWLCDQIDRRRGACVQTIASALIITEMLVESVAIARFGPAMVKKARSILA